MTEHRDPLPFEVVLLAARLLPASYRRRYATELTAELLFLPPERRWGHALRVLVRVPRLRAVLVELEPAHEKAEPMTTQLVPPLHCRLHVWHAWRVQHRPGVQPYVACTNCGRERTRTIFDSVTP